MSRVCPVDKELFVLESDLVYSWRKRFKYEGGIKPKATWTISCDKKELSVEKRKALLNGVIVQNMYG